MRLGQEEDWKKLRKRVRRCYLRIFNITPRNLRIIILPTMIRKKSQMMTNMLPLKNKTCLRPSLILPNNTMKSRFKNLDSVIKTTMARYEKRFSTKITKTTKNAKKLLMRAPWNTGLLAATQG